MSFQLSLPSSIRTRIIILVLALFLSGMLCLAWYARRILSSDIEKILGEQQFSVASVVSLGISHELQDRQIVLMEVARRAADSMRDGPAAVQRYLEQRWGMRVRFREGLYILGLDGATIAAVPEAAAATTGPGYLSQEYVARALQGESVIGLPTLDAHSKASMLVMAVPIYDEKRGIVGVLAGVSALHSLNFVRDMALDPRMRTEEFLLVEPRQRIVATATEPALAMKPLPPPGLDAFFDSVVSGHEGVGVVGSLFPEKMLVAAKSVPMTDWVVLACSPLGKAFATLQTARNRLAAITVALAALIAFSTWWALTRQLFPLLHSSQALTKMAKDGSRFMPLSVVRPDEVGLLISSFNQVLRQLQQNESLFRQMMETSSAAIFLMDTNRTITYANPRMAEMFGLSLDELLGREYLSLVHESQIEDSRIRTRTVMNEVGQPCVDHERLYVRQDGSEFWGRLNGRALFDPDGRKLGLVTVLIDVSENKRYERELRLAASVFSHAQEGIMIADASESILDVNDAFCRMTGYSREEVVGRNPEDLVRSGYHSPEFYDNLWAQLSQHGFWSGEIWNRRKDGSLYPELLTISIVRNELGDVGHYVAICTDISTLKEHERQLESMAHHDALTGLPNRLLLADRLEQAMHHAERTAKPLALVYLDVDGFKEINDLHGHDVGDQALILLTERLKAVLRESDTIARLGGDEFVVLLPELEKTEDCLPMLTRLMNALSQPARIEGLELSLSVSLGVTFYPQSGPIDADYLLRQADTAMYQAKQAGKGRFQFFTANPDASVA